MLSQIKSFFNCDISPIFKFKTKRNLYYFFIISVALETRIKCTTNPTFQQFNRPCVTPFSLLRILRPTYSFHRLPKSSHEKNAFRLTDFSSRLSYSRAIIRTEKLIVNPRHILRIIPVLSRCVRPARDQRQRQRARARVYLAAYNLAKNSPPI